MIGPEPAGDPRPITFACYVDELRRLRAARPRPDGDKVQAWVDLILADPALSAAGWIDTEFAFGKILDHATTVWGRAIPGRVAQSLLVVRRGCP